MVSAAGAFLDAAMHTVTFTHAPTAITGADAGAQGTSLRYAIATNIDEVGHALHSGSHLLVGMIL